MTAFLEAKSIMRAILDEASLFTAHIPRQVPVTIGWGTRDLLLPPRQAVIAWARLPQARIVPLPGCGHVPMTDNPELVAEVLLTGSMRVMAGRQSGGTVSPASPSADPC